MTIIQQECIILINIICMKKKLSNTYPKRQTCIYYTPDNNNKIKNVPAISEITLETQKKVLKQVMKERVRGC